MQQFSHCETDRSLSETETRLRLLLDSAVEGIYALDLEGRCTFCNTACLRLLGYQRKEDLLGQNMHALIHHTRKDGSAYALIECQIYEAFQKKAESHVDDEVLWRADGSPFEAEYWSYPIWEDGRVTGSVVTFLDITDRKRGGNALEESEQRFRSIVQQSPFPTLVHADDGEIIEISHSCLELTGYRRDELRTIGDWTRLAYGERQDAVQADIDRLYQLGGRLQEGENRVRTRGGEERVWDFSSAPLPPLPDGRRVVVSKAMDVTERIRSADALREGESQLRQVIESLPQLVWTCQPDGSCDYLGPQWINYTGIPLAEQLGSGWSKAIHPDDQERAMRSWMASVSSGQTLDLEYRIRRVDGVYRWFRALARPLRSDNGHILKWFGTCTDIEERKRQLDEIARLNATLEQRVDEKTRQLQIALQDIENHARQMQALNEAALSMRAVDNLEQLIQVVTDRARETIGAHQAITSFPVDGDWSQAITRLSLSGKYADYREYATLPDGSGIYALVCESNRALRMTQHELESHSRWRGFGEERENRPPMRGWLAVPLIGSQGKNLGLIQLSDRYEGDFTESDESLLMQLSRLASAAIENARLYEETSRTNVELQRANAIVEADRKLIAAIHEAESNFIVAESDDNVFERMLDSLLELTGSEYGFIDELFYSPQGEPYLIARAITNISWNDEARQLYDQIIGGDVAFTNLKSLYGEVMITGEPLIANDAPNDPRRCGTPPGHPALNSFLGLPLFSSQRFVGMIGLANREEGYDEMLVTYLKPMLSACGNLLSAWRSEQERKKAEEELRSANADLKNQSEQLQAANKELEAFSYSVSHDLRAPLRSVDSFSRIVLEDYGPQLDAEGHRLLSIVREDVQRMGQLIDDLLQFSRTGRQLMEPGNVNMTNLARTAYEDIPEQSRQHVQTFDLGALPAACGDRAMLRQVWCNLLSNAVKFTAHTNNARIEVSGSTRGDDTVYCVKDNGVGFDPRFTHKLFGVFQRLHAVDEFEGTGVGLAIVQRVIHRHHGNVWAEGTLNDGAAFFFSLPNTKPKDSRNGRE